MRDPTSRIRIETARQAYFNTQVPCGTRLVGDNSNSFITVISIHRSLAGPDLNQLDEKGERKYFNPQVPCGTRPKCASSLFRTPHFNPQVPCGTRLNKLDLHAILLAFQSTGPLRDPTSSAALGICSGLYFNPQVPCGTRLLVLSLSDVVVEFQSTGPLRDPTSSFWSFPT